MGTVFHISISWIMCRGISDTSGLITVVDKYEYYEQRNDGHCINRAFKKAVKSSTY